MHPEGTTLSSSSPQAPLLLPVAPPALPARTRPGAPGGGSGGSWHRRAAAKLSASPPLLQRPPGKQSSPLTLPSPPGLGCGPLTPALTPPALGLATAPPLPGWGGQVWFPREMLALFVTPLSAWGGGGSEGLLPAPCPSGAKSPPPALSRGRAQVAARRGPAGGVG